MELFEYFRTTFIELYPSLLQGLKVTVEVTFISIIFVMLIGFISCMMELSHFRVLRALSKLYVFCIRGTPFMVQLYITFFGISQLLGFAGIDFHFSAFTASILTCSINGGAYMTEVFRGSILSVEKGQIEAAKSLGVSRFNTMKSVIMPQALRNSISSIGNQFIITFKDTSICSAIALMDIVYMGKLYIGRTLKPFVTYLVISVFYMFVIAIVSLAIKYIEERLRYENKN